jgi:hypothetical protein
LPDEVNAAASNRRRSWLRQIVREPLIHFLLAGLLIYLVAEHWRAENDLYRIAVTPERVAQIRAAHRTQYGGDPDAATLGREVDSWIADEMLYREGLARGFDRDDEIVRRRLIQKVGFIEQGAGDVPAVPDEAVLQAWFDTHRADYARPAKVNFSHIFFADGAEGSAGSRKRAETVLRALGAGIVRAPERGDSFPDLYDFSDFGPAEARRLFGEGELADKLFAVPPGQWSGHFRSAYGWHLVRVSARRGPRQPTFAEVRDQVAADLAAAQRARAVKSGLTRLRAKFTVVRQD